MTHDTQADLENARLNFRGGGWFTLLMIAILAVLGAIGLYYLLT